MYHIFQDNSLCVCVRSCASIKIFSWRSVHHFHDIWL